MARSFGLGSSPAITAIGIVFALIAVVGTQFLGWEWGSGQFVPIVIGVVAAVVGVFVFVVRRG